MGSSISCSKAIFVPNLSGNGSSSIHKVVINDEVITYIKIVEKLETRSKLAKSISRGRNPGNNFKLFCNINEQVFSS